jgi:hypothetical protein
VQIGLGVLLFAAVPVSVYQHMPAKYLLVSAPAAALLVGRALESRVRSGRWLKVGGTAVAGIVMGALIVQADAAFADLGRRSATELIRPHVAQGRTVWFAGHWGFQWYAEREGARCLALSGRQPAPGDLIVSSEKALGGVVTMFNPRTAVAAISDEAPGGRIMSRRGGAGFYSNAWGYLPWTWSDEVRDRYTLWRLEADTGYPARSPF